jgi:hypothetical protein
MKLKGWKGSKRKKLILRENFSHHPKEENDNTTP